MSPPKIVGTCRGKKTPLQVRFSYTSRGGKNIPRFHSDFSLNGIFL
ncbi:hypothetical protein RUMCAL_02684 [Ruminococcus callidus ATCC 27760]|uniref:Uncharacterized protein n=1 Tax=Ruminococcus callidus ATCC 27760 TaxID=411473 RepID=U2LVL4_9FIRM|nr:hypothetical protein RUMCAL_02684 [Ruminococcus callidus ATCC 27760]